MWNQFITARCGKHPWSTKAFICKACQSEHHDYISCGIITEAVREQHAHEGTLQGLITLEEVMEAYIVGVVAKFHCSRQQLISCRVSTCLLLWQGKEVHQQQPWFLSETPGCSGRLWRLWRNLLPSDGELHAACRPGDGSRCIAEHLGAPPTNLWASGSTSNHSRAFWEKQHLLWDRCWCTWNS